jgi:hypothetical protein
MTLSEPTTALTDYGLFALGTVLGGVLLRRESFRSRRLLGGSVIASAVAAAFGGTVHGFSPVLSPTALSALWIATYTAIGVANLLMLAAAAQATLPRRAQAWVVAALIVRMAAYLVLVLPHRHFRFVVYDYALTLAALLLCTILWMARSRPAAPWIAAAVLVCGAGAWVQHSRLILDPRFNHNDLFHVIQMFGLYLFFEGGRRLQDTPE